MMFKFKSLSIAALSLSLVLNSCGMLNAAAGPDTSNLGTTIGITQVSGGEVTLDYTGEAQNLININDYYKGTGTVKYKLEDDGTFSETVPTATNEGKYHVYYYILGDPNYNDYDSTKPLADEEARISASPSQLVVNIVKKESSDQSNDGSKDDSSQSGSNSGSSSSNLPMNISYSVAEDGTTSAIVDRYGIIWLREESDGKGAWYGLDNTNGTFAIGSRFWVKWLSEGDPEYSKYYNLLDDDYKKRASTDKLWIFKTGVTKPDGKTEYENFYLETGKTAGLYIQLGDDWDANDIDALRNNALFVREGTDDVISVQFGSASTFSSIYKYAGVLFPENGSTYARLVLTHFSAYALFGDKKTSNLTSSLSSLSPYYNALSTKTGEDYSSILYLSLMSSISLMYVLISRKRKIRD